MTGSLASTDWIDWNCHLGNGWAMYANKYVAYYLAADTKTNFEILYCWLANKLCSEHHTHFTYNAASLTLLPFLRA